MKGECGMELQQTRRAFVGTAAGMAGAAALGMAGMAHADEAASASSSVEGVSWDAAYDVVVVGFGAAGGVTAITAAEQGAKVLLVEKAMKGIGGGNSRVCAQGIYAPLDVDATIQYIKAIFTDFTTVSDEMLERYAREVCTIQDWLLEHGAPNLQGNGPDTSQAEYPDAPGAESCIKVSVAGRYYFSDFYKMLKRIVGEMSDSIDVIYSAPAKKLIQDPVSKGIMGVTIEKNGTAYNVLAKNGVVLTTGGFENDQEMLQNFLQMSNACAKGSSYNTGDGIRMATECGAELWHMSNVAGPDINFKAPELDITFGMYMQDKSGFGSKNTIFVGSDGTRFTNEASRPKHGNVYYHGSYRTLQVPNPCFIVFDNVAMTNNKIYDTWSEGNVDELNAGWIVQADTLEELAEKVGIDPAGLVAEVEKYNGYCEAGSDYDFGRDPELLNPITEPPFYAMEGTASLLNTMGGPKRDIEGGIVDVHGNIIPHLYSAGELGSIYADTYQGSGNLAECIVYGRISGANAAAEKDDAYVASASIENALPLVDEEPQFELGENEYLGVGDGMGGDLYVKVRYVDGTVEDVEVVYNLETPYIGSAAVEQLPAKIVEANSTEVDSIAGASVTSDAIKAAVLAAIEQA